MNATKSAMYKKIEESLVGAPSPRIIESGQGAYLTIGGKKLVNMCSSHYLGFAQDDRIKKAVGEAVEKYGVGTGYRTLAGTHVLHVELETALAHFKGAEAAILLSSGYMANLAAIQTLFGKEDIIISDALNHASIIDAVRLSQAKNKLIYKHADMADLAAQLKQAGELAKTPKANGETPQILIVTDGVFSMDGDLAPLPEIVKLAEEYGAFTMVDDAHGEGVVGKGGRGIVDHFNLHGKVDIEVGTLSKAFSAQGGFIAGSKTLIDFYKKNARQFLFSIALTIPDTAAVLAGVKILEESAQPVEKLWENTKYLREKLSALGFDCGNSETPITPVMLGDEDKSVAMSAKLLEEGIFATPIKFPMVPKGTARIRLIPSAAHSKVDLDLTISAFEKVGKALGIIS